MAEARPHATSAEASYGAGIVQGIALVTLPSFSAGVAGGVIAFYQVGYGIAAFGVGPLDDAGVELSTIYAFAAGTAVPLAAWSFAVARRRPSPASLHPHVGHA